jgi:MurNAc alpha-1-phosphate uridylyltransferase
MKAMILSAGYGKRLNPLTLQHPKPLLKIYNETLLSNTIKFLESYGIKQAVINVHYLGDQIIDYIKKNKFNLNIKIIKEEEKILDTGGGILNAIQYFDEAFLCINPDTIWSLEYIKELNLLEKDFFIRKSKCSLLVVNKQKSFDKSFSGDFNLENGLINRKNKDDLQYIYTGLQLIRPEIFKDINKKVFSINAIWNNLIESKELHGFKSNNDFLHVSTLKVYKNLLKKLNIK